MSSSFIMRIPGKSGKYWITCGGDFERAVKGTISYLEKSCPDMVEDLLLDVNYMTGMGYSSKYMAFDEEKHFLEALKLSYPDREKEIAQLPDGSDQKKYLLEIFLPKFCELIAMIEEEVRDIERGRLIVQEDGSAIVNESFNEE